jgi:hypothetical protein
LAIKFRIQDLFFVLGKTQTVELGLMLKAFEKVGGENGVGFHALG